MLISMKPIVPLLCLTLTATPVLAKEPSPLERGMQRFLDGLREDLAPSLDEMDRFARKIGPSMRSFIEEMGPALAKVMEQVEDWSRYERPEILPNGDILIRRKPDPAPEPPQAELSPDGSIDI